MIPNHKPLNAGFFRGVNSPELFKAFFSKYKVWDSMGLTEESKNDEIYAAWTNLQNPQKPRMEEALAQINDIGRDDGQQLLLQVAEEAKVPKYGELTPQKLAMTLRLYYRDHFDKAYEYYNIEHVDSLKVLLGAEPAPCEPTDADKERFKNKLRTAMKKLAHGKELTLEEGPHPEGRWVLVVPHEQPAKPDYEFDENNPGQLRARDRRPVYDLVLIYSPADGILKLKVGRGRNKADTVASIFAAELLHKSADHFKGTDVIRFTPLFQPGFKFSKIPGDSFDWARPLFIEFQTLSDSTRYTIKCEGAAGGGNSVMDKLTNLGLTASTIRIRKLGIEFRFPGDGRKGRFTVLLSSPSWTNLDDTTRSRYIEGVLIRWGFYYVKHAKQGGKSSVAVGQAV